jgi:hypothetical protein
MEHGSPRTRHDSSGHTTPHHITPAIRTGPPSWNQQPASGSLVSFPWKAGKRRLTGSLQSDLRPEEANVGSDAVAGRKTKRSPRGFKLFEHYPWARKDTALLGVQAF